MTLDIKLVRILIWMCLVFTGLMKLFRIVVDLLLWGRWFSSLFLGLDGFMGAI